MWEGDLLAQERDAARLAKLIEVGIALSAERDHARLMERILVEAQALCDADGGTLYLRTGDDRLAFEIVRSDSLGIALGGASGEAIAFPALALYDAAGAPNERNVATHAALRKRTVNIADAYTAADFDFSGTQAFDARTGYRSTSFLTVPLQNYAGEVIGVLQLINALDRDTGEVVAFDAEVQPLVEALASQAAVALDNQMLLEAQKNLLESFIQLIAAAINEKSPYTGGHCQRVLVLTEMLAAAACRATSGPFAAFDLSEAELYELHIAGWLHDCGKVTTPEYVVDKATKLETIYDRIETIGARFEVLERDAEISYLEAHGEGSADRAGLEAALAAEKESLAEDLAFTEKSNIGAEFMAPDDVLRIERIATRRWRRGGDEGPVLTEDEVHNLSIGRGTLTAEEREVINNHVVMTIKMLEQLPFPPHLRRVPEYAGGHHERMDGGGYPRGLNADQMSLPARMMAIADIFEALTAADRPYKQAKSLSESLAILHHMSATGHIDRDLFRLFLEAGVHKAYAERFLLPEQIDEVDVSAYLA